MIANAKSDRLCMVPGCTRAVGPSRGICQSCYQTAKRLVDTHETTWEALQAMGLIRPVMSVRVSPMRAAFIAASQRSGDSAKRKAKPAK